MECLGSHSLERVLIMSDLFLNDLKYPVDLNKNIYSMQL